MFKGHSAAVEWTNFGDMIMKNYKTRLLQSMKSTIENKLVIFSIRKFKSQLMRWYWDANGVIYSYYLYFCLYFSVQFISIIDNLYYKLKKFYFIQLFYELDYLEL